MAQDFTPFTQRAAAVRADADDAADSVGTRIVSPARWTVYAAATERRIARLAQIVHDMARETLPAEIIASVEQGLADSAAGLSAEEPGSHLSRAKWPTRRDEQDALEVGNALLLQQWADLRERLENANRTLAYEANLNVLPERRAHLVSKAEGVRLALSYMDDTDRPDASADAGEG